MDAPHSQISAASMRRASHSRGILQAQARFHARIIRALPQRPRLVPSQIRIEKPTTVTSATHDLQRAIKHYGRDARGFVPTRFTWDEGPGHLPGTAEYYKSSAFRKKKNTGRDLAAGAHPDDLAYATDSIVEKIDEKSAKPRECTSLVVIFSSTNVRRASDKRMVHKRLQNYNRRT